MLKFVSLLLGNLIRWSYDHQLLQKYEGIKICDIINSDETQSHIFLTQTIAALEMIKKHDLRRFHRVQKHLDYVVNCRILEGALYNPQLRSCKVDFSKLQILDIDEDMLVFMLACILIHESTHGAVSMQNVTYDKKYRLRIERLCHNEEVCFARRARPDLEIVSFDESWYNAYYSKSLWKYAVNTIRYICKPNQPAAS